MNRETIAADVEQWLAEGNQITQIPSSLDIGLDAYLASINATMARQRTSSRVKGNNKMIIRNNNRRRSRQHERN